MNSVIYPVQRYQNLFIVNAAVGSLQALIVSLNGFNCLGHQIERFPVLPWNLPGGINTSGLLGRDFLDQIKAVVDIHNGTITVEQPEPK